MKRKIKRLMLVRHLLHFIRYRKGVLPRFYISMRHAKVAVWNNRRSITMFPYEMAARKKPVNISLSNWLNAESPGDVRFSATTIQ